MIEFISNGVDINMPDDYAIWMFFSKMLRTKYHCFHTNPLNTIYIHYLVVPIIITRDNTGNTDVKFTCLHFLCQRHD